MIISVILVSYNTKLLTKQAIEALLLSSCYESLQIIVIDNASKDDSVAMLKTDFPQIQLIENKTNVGFGRANNQAVPYLKGEFILLLNTDAFVEVNTIQQTVAFMQSHHKTGILGVKLIGRDGVLQPSCRYFPTIINLFVERSNLDKLFKSVKLVDDMNWDHRLIKNCDWVPGCYYLMSRKMVEEVGLFDPLYFLYCEEVDHCFAVKRAGWDVTYYAGATVVHIGGESAKSDGSISNPNRQLVSLQIESELLYFRKNHGLLVLLSHVILQNIADCITLAKNTIKLRPIAYHHVSLRHTWLTWQLLLKTKFGQVATR